MNKLDNIVGKRISAGCIGQNENNGRTQVLLFFSDGSFCVFLDGNSEITVEFFDGQLKTADESALEKKETHKHMVTELFHSLWGQAGTSLNYDKKKWNEMMSILLEADMIE